MSRFSQYNKNETYRDNLKYANVQKERRTNEELAEIERDRKAMERLQIELDQEKKLEKERKNQIKQQQFQDYSNYMKQKYGETPQNRERLNIKVGGEQRFIRKPNYNQQMDNLCLNPTKQENIYPIAPIQNFSEAGRNYQRGYSHGYNILTGEAYSQQDLSGKKTPKNISNPNTNFDLDYNQQERISGQYPKEISNKEISNKEKEDLNQYQQYMEMKRQKEQEKMYFLQQQEKEKQLDNKNIETNNQLQPQSQSRQTTQNCNDYNSKDNYEQRRINQNEIPLEYREMYLRQQMEQEQQQLELQRQQQEIPLEYKEMYMRQQIEQHQQKDLEGYKEEIPPEYRELYMREKMQQNSEIHQMPNEKEQNNQFNPKSSKGEIQNEYNDIMNQQNSQKHGRATPYDMKMNNYNHQNYHNTSNEPKTENKNIINKDEQITEQEYKNYLLLQQKDKEKEKDNENEDENMEIYQNMLREQEKQREQQQMEQMQNNQEREQYLQYLLEKEKQNQIKDKNINQIIEAPKYEEKPEININKIPQQEKPNEYNNQPINSFEDYYKQKGINIPQQQSPLSNPEIPENKYESNIPYPKEIKDQNNLAQQEQGFDEQAYLMYQKQRKLQEMQELEERERARLILERQQMEKMNMNNYNYNQENDYYEQIPQNYNSPYNNQIPERKSEYNSAKMEYLQNKQKNMFSKDNIFSVQDIPKPQPKYNNEPLTNADRIRIQREYAQFLDAQINAKNMKNSKNKNNGLGPVQSGGYDVGGPNPYQQLRDKHNKLKDIPQDPYSTKNYNISNNSYLSSNPITNPVNSYKFVDRRRVSSGRLQNNGSNIIGK